MTGGNLRGNHDDDDDDDDGDDDDDNPFLVGRVRLGNHLFDMIIV